MTTEEFASRAAQRRRILLKLGALCEAYPDRDMIPLLTDGMEQHGPSIYGSWQCWATDDEVEQVLDAAMAEAGVTVSGGWRS